jgi:hypothetical protein
MIYVSPGLDAIAVPVDPDGRTAITGGHGAETGMVAPIMGNPVLGQPDPVALAEMRDRYSKQATANIPMTMTMHAE